MIILKHVEELPRQVTRLHPLLVEQGQRLLGYSLAQAGARYLYTKLYLMVRWCVAKEGHYYNNAPQILAVSLRLFHTAVIDPQQVRASTAVQILVDQIGELVIFHQTVPQDRKAPILFF